MKPDPQSLDAAFTRFVTSQDSQIPAGTSWDDPAVLNAKAAFLAGAAVSRADALEEAAKLVESEVCAAAWLRGDRASAEAIAAVSQTIRKLIQAP